MKVVSVFVSVSQRMQMFQRSVGRKAGLGVVVLIKRKEPTTKIWKPCFIYFKTILTRYVIIVWFSSTVPADYTAQGRHFIPYYPASAESGIGSQPKSWPLACERGWHKKLLKQGQIGQIMSLFSEAEIWVVSNTRLWDRGAHHGHKWAQIRS